MTKVNGLSINRRGRHRPNLADFMWTLYEPAYRDSPAGNLERSMVSRSVPLQQGFHGDCQAGLTVAVDNLAASFASEQRIDASVSFTHSTAVGAPLGRVPSINGVQSNAFIETTADQVPPEGVEGDSHCLTVESPPLRTEPLQVLNGDVSIVLKSNIGDVSNHFSNSVLHEIMLPCSGAIELLLGASAPSVCVELQKPLPLKDGFAPFPDALPEVKLFKDFPFRRQHANGKAFAVDIDAEDVPSFWNLDFSLRQICDNLQIRSKPESLASPTASKQTVESIPIPVLFDGDSNSSPWIEPEFDEVKPLSSESLAVSRDIELHGNAIDTLTPFLLPPDTSGEIANNLSVESSELLGFGADSAPEISEPSVIRSFSEKAVGFGGGFLHELGKNPLLGIRGLTLKENSTLEPTDQNEVISKEPIRVPTQYSIPPTHK